jgi:hypothetical protein
MSRKRHKMYVPQYERENMAKGLKRLGLSSYSSYIRSGSWEHTRRRLRRDCCEICGTRSTLALHHMTYARLGTERPEDVCTLCSECHGMVHTAARLGGTLYPQEVMDAREDRPPQPRDIGALRIGCPTCSARPGEACRTVSGHTRSREHQERRRFADALTRRKGQQKAHRAAKKTARSTGLTLKQFEDISAARKAEFPLDDLRSRTRLGR